MPSEKPTNLMPMISHGSIQYLAYRPEDDELKLSYITICVHRNIMWRGKRKRGEKYMIYPMPV